MAPDERKRWPKYTPFCMWLEVVLSKDVLDKVRFQKLGGVVKSEWFATNHMWRYQRLVLFQFSQFKLSLKLRKGNLSVSKFGKVVRTPCLKPGFNQWFSTVYRRKGLDNTTTVYQKYMVTQTRLRKVCSTSKSFRKKIKNLFMLSMHIYQVMDVREVEKVAQHSFCTRFCWCNSVRA